MSKWLKALTPHGSMAINYIDDTIPRFLVELSGKAAKIGIKPRPTSAYRSPADQVRVVCNNVSSTGGKNLSIYGKQTREMYRKYCPPGGPRDTGPLIAYETARLQANMKRDPNYQGHGTGRAVDLSVRGLSHAQKVEYKALIEKTGAKVLWETAPEHFHVWTGSWKGRKGGGLLKWLLIGAFGYIIFTKGEE